VSTEPGELHSVVDAELLTDLYQIMYAQTVEHRVRSHIRPFLHLRSIEERARDLVATFDDLGTGEPVPIDADVVVLATGYQRPQHHPLLDLLEPSLLRDDDGRLRVARDYRVETDDRVHAGIYLQGFSEHSHGLTDTILSLLPVRADVIAQSMLTEPSPAPTSSSPLRAASAT